MRAETMRKATAIVAVLCMTLSATGQESSVNPQNANPHPASKKAKDEITVQGCLSRSNTDYILIQPEKGNSYQLERSRKIKLGPYLGQQVEVTGPESPSMSTSSDYLARSGSASPVTIRVREIKTIQKRCSN